MWVESSCCPGHIFGREPINAVIAPSRSQFDHFQFEATSESAKQSFGGSCPAVRRSDDGWQLVRMPGAEVPAAELI